MTTQAEEGRLDGVEKRMAALEGRMSAVENRMGSTETRLAVNEAVLSRVELMARDIAGDVKAILTTVNMGRGAATLAQRIVPYLALAVSLASAIAIVYAALQGRLFTP